MTNYNDIIDKLTAAIRSRSAFIYKGAAYDVYHDRHARIMAIDHVSADYLRDCTEEDRSIEPVLLERLADAILYEELTDTSSAKATREEYPFLSDTQLARRRSGRHTRRTGVGRGETSIEMYESGSEKHHIGGGAYLSTDGRDYRIPIQRTRSINELIAIDENTVSRNKERAAQYRKDTAAGRCVTYTDGMLSPEFVACRGLGERWRNELSVP